MMHSADDKKFTYDRDTSTVRLLEDPDISLKIMGFMPEQGFVWILGHKNKSIGLTNMDPDGTKHYAEITKDGSVTRIIADIGIYVSNGSRRPPYAPSYKFHDRSELEDTLQAIERIFSVLPDDDNYVEGTGCGKLRFSNGMLERIENGAYIR